MKQNQIYSDESSKIIHYYAFGRCSVVKQSEVQRLEQMNITCLYYYFVKDKLINSVPYIT